MPARGEFHAELTRVDFDRLLMQRVVEKLPRVLNVATHSKRAAIMFATDQSQPTIHVNGSALSQHGRSIFDAKRHVGVSSADSRGSVAETEGG